MHASTRAAFAAVAITLGAAPSLGQPAAPRYPETRTVPHTDEYWGTRVADPYRWLENDVREDDAVARWVEAQNEVTDRYLGALGTREAIRERLTELWNYERISAPTKIGTRYMFSKNDGLQNQSVVYVQESLDAEPRVLFDPNTWSEDGTLALGGLSVSDDGKYAAYAIQDGGSDWRTWKVRDVATGEDLADTLEYLKFTGVAWLPDGSGFFYSKFPDPAEGSEFQSLNTEMKVMFHRLGTPQAEDTLVHWDPDHPEWGYQVSVSEDGRYLVITTWIGTDSRYRVLVRDLAEPYAMPAHLVGEFDNDYSFVGNDGRIFYFLTDDAAPARRLIAIDLERPAREHWRTIIPEREATLEGVSLVNNQFIASYLEDVKTRVERFALDGRELGAVELPGVGTASGFGGRRSDTETFYTFTSLTTPPSTYRYDLLTGESELIRRPDVDIDPDRYVTKQVFYTSRDGTRVPMFIAHKKGLSLDGDNPTLLYGYGGFSISLRPSFSVSRMAWMEMGGVYAVANLRGGGEYGKAWHKAGTKTSKQNVFDDFIAAAEHLIDEKYTRPDRLAIEGGSNGGLLVGAVMTQRPELFGAAIPRVGVMDMLRFDRFTAGRYWVDDYGSASESEEMFEYLLGYSPYHNIRGGVAYPATMVMTADTDDRVVPGHSFKFAARLQASHTGTDPVLIRIETRAGHGAGTPVSKTIEELADVYAFLANELRFEPTVGRGD